MPAQAGTPTGAQRDGEVLPQEQILFHERAVASECGEHDADEEGHPIQHGGMIAYLGRRHADSAVAPYRSSEPAQQLRPR